ncbi:MAG: mechanosensitive ion channel domain-containing protein [Bacilli bacterium]
MKQKMRIMALAAVLITILTVPVMFDEAYAIEEEPNTGEITSLFGILPVSDENPVKIKAGGEETVRIVIKNITSSSWSDVSVQAVGTDHVEVLNDPEYIGNLGAGESESLVLTFSVEKYASEGAGDVVIQLYYKTDDTSESHLIAETLTINIYSDLSSSGYFNKIMGFIPNTLPKPFNGYIGATIATLLIWAIISLAVVGLLKIVLSRPIKRNEELKDVKMRTFYSMVILFIMVYGVNESLRIMGSSEYIIDFSARVAALLYIVLGAVIGWEIYKVLVRHTFSGRGMDMAPDGVDETLIPLFNMIGKIIIVVFAAAGIFATLGADLMGIIAGAGIAGLAISLGAQNILKQFFSGISLLATRPFKAGDLIRIDGGNELKVHQVGIMNTRFKNPWNEEIITMPNDKVAASTVVNMTGENLRYRFNFYVEVTRDTNLTLANKILTDAAMDRPEIITDGSIMMPFARATGLTDSGIKIRLSAYVYDYENQWSAEAAIMERVLKEFKESGIRVAYKRYDIRTEPKGMDEYEL